VRVTDTTPYDQDRSGFSRASLARLVLCDRSVALSETAGNLAVTRYDAYTASGGRVSEALSLVELAGQLLVDAVVYERERGSSWEDIARYMGMDPHAVEERFAPELDRWNAAFSVPYHLDQTGRKSIPQLPTAAYDPENACRQLDLWAHLRLSVDDEHAVSAAVRADVPAGDATDPALHDIDGWIWQRNLAAFLELLAGYVGSDFDATDWETVALGVEATDDEDPAGWYAYPLIGITASLEVRLANAVDSDVLSVVVAGARSSALRLRIDTLYAALSSDAER
jgi:hypothetical protein